MPQVGPAQDDDEYDEDELALLLAWANKEIMR